MSRSERGLVLEIQRMSTEDGPGLRSTLFLKGCSLSCRWCHNPESISPRPQLRWSASRCLGCGECVSLCPKGALSLEEARCGTSQGEGADPDGDGTGTDRDLGIRIARESCDDCGLCEEHCPTGALEIWGRYMTPREAADELLRDRAFFGFDGGVTVSGGEASLQALFVRSVLRLLKEEGVGTALDTSGFCTDEQLLAAVENADLVLYDIKDSDPERHLRNTGGDLSVVLRNFRLLSQPSGDRARTRFWVRTPIIPGLADSPGMIEGIARFLVESGAVSVERWELCAFNNLCREKYRQLGGEWELAASPLMEADRMDRLVDAAIRAGWPADRIRWTGMTEAGGTGKKEQLASPVQGSGRISRNEEAPCACDPNG